MTAVRIAFVLYDFDSGGMTNWIYSLGTRLRPTHEVFFIATHVVEIAPRFAALGQTFYVPSTTGLVRVLRTIRPDVVQYGQERVFGDCAMAACVPVVIERTDGRRQLSLTQTKRDLDAVIASTRGTLPILERLAPGRVHLICNGIDANRFNNAVPDRLGLPDSAVVVGAVARFGRGKNLELLIEAVRRLADRHSFLRLVLVGGNSRMPGAANYESVLRARARGLENRIVFAGRVERPEQLVAGFDIGACVSRAGTEGIPNAVLEMMAAGKPVVATDVDDIGEVVEHERTGLLIRDDSLDDVVAALDRLAGDATLRRQLGGQGRARVAADFDLDHQAEKYRRLYAQLIDNESRPRGVRRRSPRVVRSAFSLSARTARRAAGRLYRRFRRQI
jgi:glycosyltransferase involved in cell wall biosynthesis